MEVRSCIKESSYRYLGVIFILILGALTGYAETEPPQLKRAIRPLYPASWLGTGERPSVNLEFTIEEEGGVGEIEVEGEAPLDFVEAAKQAVGQWLFTPARQAGEAVRLRVKQVIQFTEPNMDDMEEKFSYLTALASRPAYILPKDIKGPAMRAHQLEEKPLPKNGVTEIIPREQRAFLKPGWAVVEYTITREGRVINPNVVAGQDASINARALAKAIQLDYDPVRFKGKKYNIVIRQRLEFR